MACVADGPEPGEERRGDRARKLVRDPNSEIRADAARVLAMSAAQGQGKAGGVGDALVELLDDSDRDVRVIAIRAVGGLGADAPKTAARDDGEDVRARRRGREARAAARGASRSARPS